MPATERPGPRRSRQRTQRILAYAGGVALLRPLALSLPRPSATALNGLVQRLGPASLVLLVFAVTALIVPVMTPVAIGDDWVYAISVERLVQQGELRILDLSVVTLLFQIAWGSLFALIFGPEFGILRLSTVVISLFGGLACYGIARELCVDRAKSALGAAAHLFNPLSFALSYTFMTDPHFTALLTIATFGYVRGLRTDVPDRSALLFGASVAACAFLVRQQGALIPAAVMLALLVQRCLRLNRASLALLLRVAAIPVIVIVLYYVWIAFVHGLPEQQAAFSQQVTEAGLHASALLVGRMTFVEAMYIGLFFLPVAIGAFGAYGRAVTMARPAGWLLVGAWTLMLAAGIRHFDRFGFDPPPMPRMPYLPQYFGPAGIGPADLVGQRSWLVSWQWLDVLTAVCALASIAFALLLVRRLTESTEIDPTRTSAVLVMMIALAQAAGAWLPSFHFRDWIVSVDRYLLPLLPLTICLGLWAARGLPWSQTGAGIIVTVLALVSIAGTRDVLVLQETTWRLAREAQTMGVPLTQIDGGAAWDGYHLYEYSIARGIDQQTPGGPWWTDLFGPATTSDYLVASIPAEGYVVLRQVEVSSWLAGPQPDLYLLRRQGLPRPP